MNPPTRIASTGVVTKLSSSDIAASITFYTAVLGFVVDNRYTINASPGWGTGSYVQLRQDAPADSIVIGLFKDIDHPFRPFDVDNPGAGTALTFIVPDITAVRAALTTAQIAVGDIIKSTSDDGYTDLISFFPDPDNNMLVVRQNLAGNP